MLAISPGAEADAMSVPQLDVRTANDVPTGTYFADWALPQARAITEQGYDKRTLTTTLDARLQKIARQVINRAPLGGGQVALVAMRPSGDVVAMIGGKDYETSPFNRATQARRQPGSTFKLFVYLAALRDGWEPNDVIANTPITKGAYRPKNARGSYSDTLTLEQAFAQSSNVAAVRLMREVGSDKVIATARDYGVTAALPVGDPTMALGTASMSLLELTSAYAAIAGNAFPVVPHAFPQAEQGWLERLVDGPDRLSGSTHQKIEGMLRRAVESGTGRAAGLSVPAFGKTGTTQNNRDAVFVGYAGDLVVGVWVGNDDNSPLQGVTGGGVPARIWRDFMARALNVSGPEAPRVPLPDEEQSDPGTAVEPLDAPSLEDIPLGDGTRLRVENGQVIVTTDIDGVPVDVGTDRGGIRIDGEAIEQARRRAEERAREARERARQAIEQGVAEPATEPR